ncbi:MAG: protein-glutamate O-methyltransferase [Pseudomonadota bacterium]
MTPENFKHLAQLLKLKSGLIVTEDKQYLIETRLTPVARRAGLSNLDDLVVALRKPGATALVNTVVDAMTTNETFFFRDKTPFDLLENTILPELRDKRTGRRLRIWCAAASTGQEPYSIAMVLKEQAAKMAGWTYDILGTDISPSVLEKARKASYSQFEVQRGLPIQLLLKYFTQVGDSWNLNADIKQMVHYKPLNLLDNLMALGKFDIVFCRNVLIYFDRDTKAEILSRVAKQMAPDAYLVLGAAETVVGVTDAFVPVPGKRGLYALKDGAAGAAPAPAAAPRFKVAV